MVFEILYVQLGVAVIQLASVVHGTELGKRNVPTAPAKRGSGAVAPPARTLVTVSSTAVAEFGVPHHLEHDEQQSTDWLRQSDAATPAGIPPASGGLRLW